MSTLTHNDFFFISLYPVLRKIIFKLVRMILLNYDYDSRHEVRRRRRRTWMKDDFVLFFFSSSFSLTWGALPPVDVHAHGVIMQMRVLLSYRVVYITLWPASNGKCRTRAAPVRRNQSSDSHDDFGYYILCVRIFMLLYCYYRVVSGALPVDEWIKKKKE